jgi:hypothetical protein
VRAEATAARRVRAVLLVTAVGVAIIGPPLQAWGPQGHRLVALVAATLLNAAATGQVQALLGDESLADVASWADDFRTDNNQTASWHFVNIPPTAPSYDRDRDCPRQPGVEAGSRGDMWRDCIVDRIQYQERRLADARLDRADRAIALKFLVHFVGDIHQPFHASAIERGGNGILVRVFGSDSCGGDAARPFPCNLHGVWDTQLIAHRGLNDQAYLARLQQQIVAGRLRTQPLGGPAEWAIESLTLSNAALLPQKGNADEAYFATQIPVVENRLALGGVRLAALINRSIGVASVR